MLLLRNFVQRKPAPSIDPMDPTSPPEVTQWLNDYWRMGDREALDRLIRVLEPDLRRLARSRLRREPAGHALETIDLINETFLRLMDQKRVHWQNRAQFFALAARLMRRILVDHARRRLARKRGGHDQRVSLSKAVGVPPPGGISLVDLIAIHEALENLERLDPDQARIVELRYFGELTIEEIAALLGIAPATVKREWQTAKAFLHRMLARSKPSDSRPRTSSED